MNNPESLNDKSYFQRMATIGDKPDSRQKREDITPTEYQKTIDRLYAEIDTLQKREASENSVINYDALKFAYAVAKGDNADVREIIEAYIGALPKRESVTFDEISIDVSTGDHDAGCRAFAKMPPHEIMDCNGIKTALFEGYLNDKAARPLTPSPKLSDEN